MSETKRKNCSGEFKVKVAIEGIHGIKTVNVVLRNLGYIPHKRFTAAVKSRFICVIWVTRSTASVCSDRLVLAQGAGMAVVEYAGYGILRGLPGTSDTSLRCARDIQHGPRLLVHQRGVY